MAKMMMRTSMAMFMLMLMGTTVAMAQVIDTLTPPDEIHAREKREDYEYYYIDEPEPRYFLFSAVMYVSVALITIEMLVTLYGPVIIDHPLRWHTLNYCCWNCFQLIIFANCADESEFKDFLHNDYISGNCAEIQRMTLSVYYLSMYFVAPAQILQYYFPTSKRWPIMKYYVWIPLLFCLDMGLFLTYSSQPWAWYFTGLVPIEVYQAVVTLINYVFILITFISVFCSIGQFCYYYCQYSVRADGQTYKKFIDMINFILFFVYYLIITVSHSPYNGVCMGLFLSPYVYKYVIPYIDILLPIATTMLNINQFFALLVPATEFLATFVCLKLYRNQLLQCVSCGQNRHKPKVITRNIIPHHNSRRDKFVSTIEPPFTESEQRPSTPEIKIAAGYFQNTVSAQPVMSGQSTTYVTPVSILQPIHNQNNSSPTPS